MKMPTGKNKTLVIGGAVVGGLAIIFYIRKKKTASSTATGTSGYDPNAIDPNTGLPYGQEAGVDPNTGLTYGQETGGLGFGYSGSAVNQGGAATSGTGQTVYTSNTQWMSDAQQDAQNYFGASYSLTTSALGKYLAQSPQGLDDNEYAVVSEVVAQIGQPPVGQPYRLIHAPVVNNPAPPSPVNNPPPPPVNNPPPPPVNNPPPPPPNNGIPPGYHMQPPQVATLSAFESLRTYWKRHYPGNNQALTNLINYNPGVGVDWTAHGDILIRTSEAHLVPDN
jgi:hypothetical protein